MTKFTFLHCADIHLDRALRGLPPDPRLTPELKNATRTAFSAMVGTAIEEGVAFVVIAGDLYDTDWTDYSTGHHFIREMSRLRAAGIPVYLLFGNHDAVQDMIKGKSLTLPDNVHVFSSKKAQTYRIEALDVALHGQSFEQREVVDNLSANYPEPVANAFNIGVLHTALEGRPPHATYAPCDRVQLTSHGYDYWALGHVHGYEAVSTQPWIVYPGNLQGLHVNEVGARGAVMVDVDAGQVASVRRIHPDVLRWYRLDVDMTGATQIGEFSARLAPLLQDAGKSAEGRPICVRITLTGDTAIAGQLHAAHSDLSAQVEAQADIHLAIPLFLEKLAIKVRCGASAQALAEQADAIGELRQILDRLIADPDQAASLRAKLDASLTKVPVECRSMETSLLSHLTQNDMAPILANAVDELFDRILTGAQS